MPASAPAPIGTSEPLVLNDVCTRTNEPIFRHVSVPGTYQKPAPYRLQTFTYSTGLAFTGRSAACAPDTATRPAAEPRSSVLVSFIWNPPAPRGLSFEVNWTRHQPQRHHPGKPRGIQAAATLARRLSRCVAIPPHSLRYRLCLV